MLVIQCADKTFALLCCPLPCGKTLPTCPHECAQPCHAGACPQPERCARKVTVRCACRRIKRQWECARYVAHLTPFFKFRKSDLIEISIS
jgi:hypothetical protein